MPLQACLARLNVDSMILFAPAMHTSWGTAARMGLLIVVPPPPSFVVSVNYTLCAVLHLPRVQPSVRD